jgi:ATP-binding cassette subfamily F protein 3
VGKRTISVEDGSVRSYLGGWAEFVRMREERREAGASAGEASANGGAARAHARTRARAADRSEKPSAGDAGASEATNGKSAKRERRKREGPSKNRLSAIARAERAVEDAEAAMRELEDELADPAAWATPYESAKSEARHTAARRAVEAAFAELESLSE